MSEEQIDMDSAVDQISAGLGFGEEVEDNQIPDGLLDTEEVEDTENTESEEQVVEVRAAPKSWAKETHEHWSKIPKEAQDYIELREKQMLDGLEQYKGDSSFGKQMREVMTPYKALIQAQGVDEPKAVQYLLNAHYKLSSGQPHERAQYLSELAKSYGINLGEQGQQTEIDPHLKALQDKVNQLESGLTAREQASLNEAKSRVGQQVNAFASDPNNVYFDEVSDDIVRLIKTGMELEEAYEKAVWANPVTRQKEMARLQVETEAKLREKAKSEAEVARKATSSNVRTRDTSKTPTESKGKLFSDSHEAEMREIVRKSRIH